MTLMTIPRLKQKTKGIPSYIAGNTINGNLEGNEYDAKQKELGAAAVVNCSNGSVENHHGKLEFYVSSPVTWCKKKYGFNHHHT